MLESELFAFLENAADAVFAMTDQGEIRFWNKSAEKLFGYSALEAEGKSCFCCFMASVLWAQKSATRTIEF